MTDAELVERARRGDQAAFGGLVDRHEKAALQAAVAALGSREDAEDVTQEAFLAAYRKLESYRGDASFRTWLLTITWHLALNRRKSLARRLHMLIVPNGNASAEPVAREHSPEKTAVEVRLLRDATRMVRSLPANLRDALLMTSIDQQPYEEVASVLGVPVGTLKWRVAEARRRLKEKLRRRGWTDD